MYWQRMLSNEIKNISHLKRLPHSKMSVNYLINAREPFQPLTRNKDSRENDTTKCLFPLFNLPVPWQQLNITHQQTFTTNGWGETATVFSKFKMCFCVDIFLFAYKWTNFSSLSTLHFSISLSFEVYVEIYYLYFVMWCRWCLYCHFTL